MAEEHVEAVTLLADWGGDFGDKYTARQPDTVLERRRLFDYKIGVGDLLTKNPVGDNISTVLEVGAGTGMNLEALASMDFDRDNLSGLEPNGLAADSLVKKGFATVHGTAQEIDASDGEFDLVFTCGLLIHIPPHDVYKVAREIVRVSNQYVLALEYFSDKPEMIKYQGMNDILWKRDFGLMYMEEFGLKHLDHGFAWKPVTGLDNLTWFLFEKPQ